MFSMPFKGRNAGPHRRSTLHHFLPQLPTVYPKLNENARGSTTSEHKTPRERISLGAALLGQERSTYANFTLAPASSSTFLASSAVSLLTCSINL